VGLGNPEERFLKNRHNVGWMFLDKIAQHDWKEESNYLFQECLFNGELVVLVKPTTYMNSSGEAVKEAADKYKIVSPYIYVVRDDLDLPFGTLRTKKSSYHGGHNGVKSIINELLSDRFVQIKFGIGKPQDQDIYNYVLSDFTEEEQQKLPIIFNYAEQLINCLSSYEDMVKLNKKIF